LAKAKCTTSSAAGIITRRFEISDNSFRDERETGRDDAYLAAGFQEVGSGQMAVVRT